MAVDATTSMQRQRAMATLAVLLVVALDG